MNKTVSIIIPVYNTENYLKRCVQSVLNQTYRNLEIILVNDGSTDNSLKICEEYKRLDERVCVISENNRGVSHARNVGIKKANGEYLYFADSDDYLDVNSIKKMVEEIETKKCQLVVGGYTEIEAKNNTVLKENKWRRLQLKSNEAKRLVLDEDSIGGYLWNKLFKSSIIKQFNIRFDEKIYIWEDVLFVMEYLNNCCNIAIVDDVIYTYCRREGSAVEYSKYTPKLYTQLDAIEKIENSVDLDDLTKELLQYRELRCCLGLIRSMVTGGNIRNEKLTKIRAKLSSASKKTVSSLSVIDKISWLLINIHPRLFAFIYSILHYKK